MSNQQVRNYTPIKTHLQESFIHKAFTYDLTRNKYVKIIAIVGVLIYAIISVINYFSKENSCRREVEKKVKIAGKFTGIENPYVLKKVIAEESKKCIGK